MREVEVQYMKKYSLLIKDGRIVDGSGNAWFKADLGVKDGKIARIGRIDPSESERVINAEGLTVSPGFMDPHNHSDWTIIPGKTAESYIRQGVTTVTIGHCGFSLAPVSKEHFEDLKRYHEPFLLTELSWNWKSFGEFLDVLRETRASVNVIPLVGFGTVRIAAMGFEDREPTEEEMAYMETLVDESMREGAFGLSTGLGYPPQSYAKTEEIIRLCRVVARHGGIYATHIRGSPDGLKEAIEIGKRANVPVEIAHIGASRGGRKQFWGRQKEVTLEPIERAREEGVEITGDLYPYTASSSYLAALIPPNLHEGGTDKLLERLKDEEIRSRLREKLKDLEWSKTLISYLPGKQNKRLEGKTIEEVAEMQEKSPVDVLCDLLIQERGGGTFIKFWGREEDVITLMRHRTIMISSDGWIHAASGVLHVGKPHPRSYGAFPRVLARYVREKRVLDLEEAVRKMSSQPLSKFGVFDRGLIREGMYADIVVFDPKTVRDTATYEDPHRYPEGILYVIVNGVTVIDEGEHTGATPGIVLKHRSRS